MRLKELATGLDPLLGENQDHMDPNEHIEFHDFAMGSFSHLHIQREDTLQTNHPNAHNRAIISWGTGDIETDSIIRRAYEVNQHRDKILDPLEMLSKIVRDWHTLREKMQRLGYALDPQGNNEEYIRVMDIDHVQREIENVIEAFRGQTNCVFAKDYDADPKECSYNPCGDTLYG